MSFLCPVCRAAVDLRTAACEKGHRFQVRDGVLALVEPAFAVHLEAFLQRFEAMRGTESSRLLDACAYPDLPFGALVAGDAEWRQRQEDLAVVHGLLVGRHGLRILDIGAWNGWLSHRLATDGHEVTAIDYFVDPYDGLGACRFYPTPWLAVQMDLENLSVIAPGFDVIVLNRCLQFFTDPLRSFHQAASLVQQGGFLVVTGLAFFRDPQRKRAQVGAFRSHLAAQGVGDLKPMRGYLDMDDRKRLLDAGVKLTAYRGLWRANLRSRFDPSRPWHAYGVWCVK